MTSAKLLKKSSWLGSGKFSLPVKSLKPHSHQRDPSGKSAFPAQNATINAENHSTLGWLLGELSSPAIIVVDQNCNCLFANRGWFELTSIQEPGYSTRQWLNAFHASERDSARALVSSAVASDSSIPVSYTHLTLPTIYSV